MITFFKKIIYSFIFIFPTLAFGAQAYFVVPQDTVGVEKEIIVDVYVDTEGAVSNAVEGSILFPSGALRVAGIRNGNSAINFWIESPRELAKGEVSFSGITPGGITGKSYLFSIVFKTQQEGGVTLRFNNMRMLKHDGTGENLSVEAVSSAFRISHEQDGSDAPLDALDRGIPEDFKPEIISNPHLLEGAYVAVFSTQDKGSGIDHYEIKEGFFGTYSEAESPYVLTDQSLHKKIYIKAVDRAGNERIVTSTPLNPLAWYRDYLILGILLLVCLCLYGLRKIIKKFISPYGR